MWWWSGDTLQTPTAVVYYKATVKLLNFKLPLAVVSYIKITLSFSP